MSAIESVIRGVEETYATSVSIADRAHHTAIVAAEHEREASYREAVIAIGDEARLGTHRGPLDTTLIHYLGRDAFQGTYFRSFLQFDSDLEYGIDETLSKNPGEKRIPVLFVAPTVADPEKPRHTSLAMVPSLGRTYTSTVHQLHPSKHDQQAAVYQRKLHLAAPSITVPVDIVQFTDTAYPAPIASEALLLSERRVRVNEEDSTQDQEHTYLDRTGGIGIDNVRAAGWCAIKRVLGSIESFSQRNRFETRQMANRSQHAELLRYLASHLELSREEQATANDHFERMQQQ